MIHEDNVDDFYDFLNHLGRCVREDRQDHWFFFFPDRVCYVILPKVEGGCSQPTFSSKTLAEQVKNGWEHYVRARLARSENES